MTRASWKIWTLQKICSGSKKKSIALAAKNNSRLDSKRIEFFPSLQSKSSERILPLKIVQISRVTAGNSGSPEMPSSFKNFSKTVETSSVVPLEPSVRTDRASRPKPAVVERGPWEGHTRLDSFDFDFFPLQPTQYSLKVEFPLHSNFSGRASSNEPIVNIPGLHIEFSGQFLSIHSLLRMKTLTAPSPSDCSWRGWQTHRIGVLWLMSIWPNAGRYRCRPIP